MPQRCDDDWKNGKMEGWVTQPNLPSFHLSIPASLIVLIILFSSCKTSRNTNISNPDLSKNNSTDNPKGRKLTSEQEVKFKGYFINGCRQKSLGNVELAEEQFKECLKIDPNNPDAQYELGSIYRFSGLNEEALKYSKGAAAGNPKNEWYQLLYIECLQNKKMYGEAAGAYEKLIQQYPNKPDYYRELAREYSLGGNFNKAVKVYDQMGEKFGKTPEIYLAKIKLLRRQKKNSEAEAELKKLIELYPRESNYYTYLAELYQENGQKEKAMEVYKQLLKTDPRNPYVHLALADYYRSQNNDSAFLREVKVAFKNDSLEIDQKVKILISFYALTEQYPEYEKEGLELCEILVNVHPNDPRSHTVYADFLFRAKRIKEARDEYVEALKFEKSKFIIWKYVMQFDLELRDTKALEVHSKEAIELFPNQPEPLYFAAEAQIQLKNYKTAIDLLLDAKEYVIDNNLLLTQIFAKLGDTYNYNKEYEKSDKAFDDALKLDPDNDGVLNNYSYYLSLRKTKLEQAEKMSARSNEIVTTKASYMDTYGWILYLENKLDPAKEWLEKALKAGGDKNGVILEHFGDVLFKLNEQDKAIEYWKKAKETGRGSENLDKKISDRKLYE